MSFIVAIENGLLPHARAGENDNQDRGGDGGSSSSASPGLVASFISPGAWCGRFEASSKPRFPRSFSRSCPRADRGPRPLGRGPFQPVTGVRAGAAGRRIGTNIDRPAAPRDFRLMTAAELAGAAGGIVSGGTHTLASTSTPSRPVSGSFTPSLAWGRSWPSKARAPAARGGSRSPSAPRGPLCWPSRRCGPWSCPQQRLAPARDRRSRPQR